MFIYIWFDAVGWSHDEPTAEDHHCIESGDLLVLRVEGTDVPTIVWGGQPVGECKTDDTPDGDRYHYV